MLGIFLTAVNLLPSQEGLCSMQLHSYQFLSTDVGHRMWQMLLSFTRENAVNLHSVGRVL
jgi:hypothetical protein